MDTYIHIYMKLQVNLGAGLKSIQFRDWGPESSRSMIWRQVRTRLDKRNVHVESGNHRPTRRRHGHSKNVKLGNETHDFSNNVAIF